MSHFTIYQNCQIAAYFQTETKDNQQQSIMQNRGPVKFATVVRDSEVEPKLSISVILIKRGFPTEKSLIVWQKHCYLKIPSFSPDCSFLVAMRKEGPLA